MPAVGSGRSAHDFGLLRPRHDPVELLLDDVGDLADTALEDGGLLEHGRLDAAVAIAAREVGGQTFESGPAWGFVGQQVARATGGAEVGHRPKSSRASQAFAGV